MSIEVAIVGAGLAGLALALVLHDQGITATVYENRPAPLNIGGAVMLSPNALKILDALNLYKEVRAKGYNFDSLNFVSTSGELIDEYEFGSDKKYGYSANRMYRYELIEALVAKIRHNGTTIEFGRKFSHVLEETSSQVTFQFVDGSIGSASILVGADGIHSTVRKYLYPSLNPKFVGMVGITASIPASHLSTLDGKITKPLTILSKAKGAFVIAPQRVDGSEYLIGKQKRMSDQTREGWDAISANKAAAVSFLQDDNDEFGPVAINATKDIPYTNINIWPFYMVPQLENWASEQQCVVLVGDAAHAIPPSAGQGISQAFEDVFMLALLLGESKRHGQINMKNALTFWQDYRQSRVQRVLDLNHQIDERRLPTLEGSAAPAPETKREWDLAWLYNADFKAVVKEWVGSQKQPMNDGIIFMRN